MQHNIKFIVIDPFKELLKTDPEGGKLIAQTNSVFERYQKKGEAALDELVSEMQNYFDKRFTEFQENKIDKDRALKFIDYLRELLLEVAKKFHQQKQYVAADILLTTFYKILKHFSQVYKQANIKADAAVILKVNSCLMSMTQALAEMCIQRSQLNRAMGYIEEAFSHIDNNLNFEPKSLKQYKAMITLYLSEVQAKLGNISIAESNAELSHKIDINITERQKFHDVAILLGSSFRKQENYLKSIYWYKKAITDKSKKVIDGIVSAMKLQHSDILQKFLLAEKLNDYLKVDLNGNVIIITSKVKEFKFFNINFKGDFSYDNKTNTLKVDIFSLSLDLLKTNLRLIDEAYQRYIVHKNTPFIPETVTEVKSHINENKLIEAKQEEDVPVRKEKNKTKGFADVALATIKKSYEKDKIVLTATSIYQAAELGFGSSYNSRKIIPLSNNYIPEGTYYGMFNREKALAEGFDKEVIDTHEAIFERGIIGDGIKSNKKDEDYPFKTWIPAYSKFGNFRMWAKVMEKIADTNGKIKILVDFNEPHDHKTQEKMYK